MHKCINTQVLTILTLLSQHVSWFSKREYAETWLFIYFLFYFVLLCIVFVFILVRGHC